MVILDTNVLSAAMASDSAIIAWLDGQPRSSIWTTAITVFEIRYGLSSMPTGRRRTQQEIEFTRVLEQELERRVLAFAHDAAEQTAALMVIRRRRGRLGESRDAMIAGIALTQRATLATRNVRHFGDLSVPVVDPWNP
jgi:toxin FitB